MSKGFLFVVLCLGLMHDDAVHASAQLQVSAKTSAKQLDRLQKRLPPGVVVRVNTEADIGLPPERPVPDLTSQKPQCSFPANQSQPGAGRAFSKTTEDILLSHATAVVSISTLRDLLDQELYRSCRTTHEHLSRYLLIRYLYRMGDFVNTRQALANLLMIVNTEGIRQDRIHGLTDEQTAELLKIGLVVGWCNDASSRRQWITAFTAFARKIRSMDPFWRMAHFILDVSGPDINKARADFKAWEEGEDLDKSSFVYEAVAKILWERESTIPSFPKNAGNILDWIVGIAMNQDLITEFLKEADIHTLTNEQLFLIASHKRIDVGFRLVATRILAERGLFKPIALARLFEELHLQPHLYFEAIQSEGKRTPEFLTKFETSTLLYETSKRSVDRVFFILLNTLYAELPGDYLNPASGYVSWQLETITPQATDSWFAPKAMRILTLMDSKKAGYWKAMVIREHPEDWMVTRLWWFLSSQWKNTRHIRKALLGGRKAALHRWGTQGNKGLACIRAIYEALNVSLSAEEWAILNYPSHKNVSPLADKLAESVHADDKLGFLLLCNHNFEKAKKDLDAGFFFHLIRGLMKFENPQTAYTVSKKIMIHLGL